MRYDNPSMLEGLNEPQREAVTVLDQPLLVLAGAGSGKTRTLTHKIAWLVRVADYRPHNILAVTFTNKAAREMKTRVQELVGGDIRDMIVSTFHSACVKLLRESAHAINLSPTFSIVDDQDQKSLLTRILDDMGLGDSKITPQQMANYISEVKNQMLDAETVASDRYFNAGLADVYRNYQMALEDSQALDFDDLLLRTVNALTYNKQLLSYYRDRFRYVLVDEFQDTNPVQYRLIQLLVGDSKKIFVVGDDDQSIYSWRGADLTHVFRFEEDFPGTKIIRLEQNYRSTPQILSAANALISNNTQRKGKTLFTDLPPGKPVCLTVYGGDREEAKGLASAARSKINEGFGLEDLAVLYRTNAMTRVLEDAFRREDIPYRIVGGVGFYQRREIRDLLAYLKLLLNPYDRTAFLRVLNVPRRGIGKAGLEKILDLAVETGTSPLLFDESQIGALAAAGKKFLPFHQLMDQLRGLTGMLNPSEMIDTVLDLTGYETMLVEERSEEAQQRLDNLDEFRTMVAEQMEEEPDLTLEQLVVNVSLYTDQDRDDPGGKLSMMTLHTAKGLEFPVVFLPGLEEGLMPHHRSLQSEDAIEEERRLLYVGITRAREELYLSYAQSRFVYNAHRASLQSRFLRELPEGELDVREERAIYQTSYTAYGRPTGFGNSGGGGGSYGSRPASQATHQRDTGPKVIQSIRRVSFEEDIPSGQRLNVAPGTKVRHPVLGQGKILAIEEDRVQVAFEDGKDRWLAWEYANLSL